MLRTRAPLYRGRSPFSHDLHVLGAPLTFVLSQDQTLQFESFGKHRGAKPQMPPYCSLLHTCRFRGTKATVHRTHAISRVQSDSVFKDRGEASRFQLFSVSGPRNLVPLSFAVKGIQDFFLGPQDPTRGSEERFAGPLGSAEGADTWIARNHSASGFLSRTKNLREFEAFAVSIGHLVRHAELTFREYAPDRGKFRGQRPSRKPATGAWLLDPGPPAGIGRGGHRGT